MTINLPCGLLKLSVEREEVLLDEAITFAERENSRRRYMFVGRMLGRHVPTRPADLRRVALMLARKLPEPEGKTLFIGMAETATTLAQAVYEAWIKLHPRSNNSYIDTSRRLLPNVEFLPFLEEHSHARNLRLYVPNGRGADNSFFDADSVVLIDDEITTGRTARNLFRVWLEYSGRTPESVKFNLASILSWCLDDNNDDGVNKVALISGNFEFSESKELPTFPSPLEDAPANKLPKSFQPGARGGITIPEALHESYSCNIDLQSTGANILVVAVGEFGYLPLQIAEYIESTGRTAHLQATTRSPLLIGGPITHRREFPAITGEGYSENLYNIPDDHSYDAIYLCCEDPLPPKSHPVLKIPQLHAIQLKRETPDQ